MDKREILVALTDGGTARLGNAWRITAKKSDFYLEPLATHDAMHLSAHGPNDRQAGHRFHIKIDPKAAQAARARGDLVAHAISKRGHALDGVQVAKEAWLVARIRWTWLLQRARFREASLTGTTTTLLPHQSGAALSKALRPNDAADLDLVVSYGAPYWPMARESLRDNSRLGPLQNDSGMWLAATSYRRSQMRYPAPECLSLTIPRSVEVPNRILGGGPGIGPDAGMYWFVETVTTREIVENSIAARIERP